MWLDEIDRKINAIVELVRPELKGDVNKFAKDIRDKTILKTISEFKKGVILLKYRYSKNISKPFKEITEEKDIHEYDKLLLSYNDDIEKNSENIIALFRPELQEEVKNILTNIIEETIIETTFEFQKGVESLEGHISKNITN